MSKSNRFLSTRRDFLLLAAGAAAAAALPVNADEMFTEKLLRNRAVFNRDWRFSLGDVENAHLTAYDESNWDRVGLPHSFSMPYFLSSEFYTGYGWYRKHFVLPKNINGKRFSLEFEGVFQQAEVYVNGLKVGEHSGGYNGFSIDISGAVAPGKNVVAIRVNNLWRPTLAPRGGEHVFSGGIYRNVYLAITSPLHVAWCGTFVTTPQVSKDQAVVKIETEIQNDTASGKECRIETQILSPSGQVVATVSTSHAVQAKSTQTIAQTTSAITSPMLWHPDHPNLYRAVTNVYDGKTKVDKYITPFGIRWFEFTADKGFFINGEHYYFCGANVHQDHAGWGDAVTNEGFARDVRLVKEAGFTFIRGSHYPKAPAFADECDKQGVLFWSENCFWGTGGALSDGGWTASAYPKIVEDQPGFEESVKQSLREMVRIHRNHPSIVAWSMGNETFFSYGEVMPKVREFLKELIALTHQLDATRPAAIGGVQRGEIDHIGDVAGYNGDGARLFMNPGIPNVVTEYSSTICDRPGPYDPGWGDLPMPPGQDKSLKYPWRYPWRSGDVIWCAFDHGSIMGHFGCMGIVDHFRIPKRAWYWYRNEYRGIPAPEWPKDAPAAALKLVADKTVLAASDGTDDAQILVTVVGADGKPVSATPTVTLSVLSGPGEFPTGRQIVFDNKSDIALRDGMAAIEMRSYFAGKTVIRASSPDLPDAHITIESKGDERYVSGVTRDATERPYVRYSKNRPASDALGNVALLRPTLASSEAPGHSAALASEGDGDAKTFWMAATSKAGEWWMSDLEGTYEIHSILLEFPEAANYRYH